MKILIIQPWIKQGGAELISVHLAYELQRQGHEAPIACTFLDKTGMPDQANEVQYLLPTSWLSSFLAKRRWAFLLFGPWILFWLVWRNSRDIDILNPHNFPSSWIASIVGAIKRIPVVWTCNEPPERIPLRDALKVGLGDFFGWYLASSWLDKLLVKKVAKLYVPSEKTSKQVLDRYGQDPKIIHIGLDVGFFQGSNGSHKEALDLKDKFVILVVGKLHPQKNQKVCIEAMKHVIPQVPNARLLLAGNGPSGNYLRKIAEEIGVHQQVMFLGHQSATQIRDLYHACDVNLFPVVNQSWGFTPFEALCAGKLSIVSDDCGAAEIISEGGIGIICEPTAEAFARKILDVHANPELTKAMALKGNQYVSQHLGWDSYAQTVMGVMKAVLAGRRINSIEEEVGEEALL